MSDNAIQTGDEKDVSAKTTVPPTVTAANDATAEAQESSPETTVLQPLEKYWWHYPQLIRLNLGLSCGLLAYVTQGYDGSMLNGLQALPQWADYFDHPSGATLGTMVNGFQYGNLISLFIGFWLCDRFGRRWPLAAGSLVVVVGSIIQAAAHSFGEFVAARFLIGFGTGIVGVVAIVLLTEVCYPTHRAVMVALSAVFWPVGALIAAGVTYGTFKMDTTWSWRLPSLLQGVIPLLQCGLVFLVPESPRWLVYRDRYDEAERMLVTYHGLGDPGSRLVRYELAEISAAIEVEKAERTSRWTHWVATGGNRYRFWLIVFLGFVRQLQGNALISYYLVLVLQSIGITSSVKELQINIGLQVWSVVTCAGFAVSVDRLGRRVQILAAVSIMFVAFFIWTICSARAELDGYKNTGLTSAVLLMIFVFQGGSHFFSPAVTTFIVEIPPFSLRAKASMIYNLAGTAASIFNGYVNPIAMRAISWRYYIVYVVLLFVYTVVVYLYVPETRKLSLEEIGGIFEGPDKLTSWRGVRKVSEKERRENAVKYMETALEVSAHGQKQQVVQVEDVAQGGQ